METFQLALLGRFPVHPDLLLGLVVMLALARRSPTGPAMGFVFGLMRDIVYGNPLGIETLAMTLVGWAVGSLGRSVYREAAITQGVVLFVAALGRGALVFLLLGKGELAGLAAYLLRISFPAALLTALTVPALVLGLERATRTRLRFDERKILVKRG